MTPLAVSRTKAAAMLDLRPREFDRLVKSGALPGPVMLDGYERWPVEQIQATLRGKAARPMEDFDL